MKCMIDELLHNTELFDLYGALLTDRQRECLSMYLLDDYSVSEIGEEIGTSRQAAYDMIHRAIKILEEYESKLLLLKKQHDRETVLDKAYDAIAGLQCDEEKRKAILMLIGPYTGYHQGDK